MFGWEFPPHISGGLGTACYGMTKGLAHNDVDVLFVMPSASGDEDQSDISIINASDVATADTVLSIDEFLGKVEFLRIGSNIMPYVDPEDYSKLTAEERLMQSEEFKYHFHNKYKFSGKYGTNLMEEVVRYSMVGGTLALQNNFDVIHAHDWLTYLAGIAAKRVSGKPLVIHVHATEYDRTGENVNTQVYAIEQMGMREADKVITVSDWTRNIVINKYGIDPEKVVTVHNAVDFSNRETLVAKRGVPEKTVTFLGRITFQKGPEYFIEAAYKVLQKTDNVRFVMAGSGDLLNRSIRRVAQLGMADKFHFTGFLRGADVQKMFALSDVYVMPSVSEPFGISPLEAMQSNVPTIISKQSGVAEVLKYAIKVDFWDIDALADAIYGLVTYPAIAKVAGEKGYDEVNSLKWDHAAAKIKDVYQAAMNLK
ncbi:MAG: glycosyltransferase [Bacteroidales bacterium]|nr:glycosyltransferase [Bacteroidales bacterium]MBP5317412.1 glycosyltransferase [Bacteroidales bacterium]MBR3526325.1 glycosyltransferase [Bacteroidales bacterium]MCR5828312.1 glycosyltransferase [Bacteroidales bacterium]